MRGGHGLSLHWRHAATVQLHRQLWCVDLEEPAVPSDFPGHAQSVLCVSEMRWDGKWLLQTPPSQRFALLSCCYAKSPNVDTFKPAVRLSDIYKKKKNVNHRFSNFIFGDSLQVLKPNFALPQGTFQLVLPVTFFLASSWALAVTCSLTTIRVETRHSGHTFLSSSVWLWEGGFQWQSRPKTTRTLLPICRGQPCC